MCECTGKPEDSLGCHSSGAVHYFICLSTVCMSLSHSVYMYGYACAMVYLWTSEDKVGFLLPSFRSKGVNSCHQDWLQSCLHVEPFYQSLSIFFFKMGPLTSLQLAR